MLHTYVTRLVSKYIYIYILTREIPAFQRPFGKPPPSASVKEKKKNWGAGGAPVGPSAYAALGGEKKKLGPKFRAHPAPLSGGACGAPNGFKNVTRSTRIPNMCLVLKLYNGKVVSIANGQNDRIIDGQTDVTSSTVLACR